MLTFIDVKFIYNSAWVSASLGDKGLLSAANVLQIAVVVRRVVFLLFLLYFEPIVRLFFPRQTSEMFRHFVLTKILNPVPMSSRLTVQ